MRRLAFALAAVVASASVVAGAAAAPLRLSVGEAVFWDGKAAETVTTYEVDVAPNAWRLRAAVDHPGTTDEFSVWLRSPEGSRVPGGGLETFAMNPEPGIWKIEVERHDLSAEVFRLRAKLEREPRVPRRAVRLLPNLRPEPAYDFTFSYPDAACDLVNVDCDDSLPAPVPPSCAADETAEDQAVRCLRFSFGYQNAGRGPLDLRFGKLDPVTRSVPVRQRIFLSDRTTLDYSDNEFVEREAAGATYHEIHGHFHYDNVFGAQLYRVVDEKTGEMEPVAEVAKRGACAHDIAFVDFGRFFQDPQHTADSGTDCNFTFTDPTKPAIRIGLSAGWGDIYTAGLSDNYVDFGVHPDGLYVVQVEADVDHTIDETNEKDNFGYSLIRVGLTDVELLERGRGRSPWDPSKVVVEGLGE